LQAIKSNHPGETVRSVIGRSCFLLSSFAEGGGSACAFASAFVSFAFAFAFAL
jgi:hypothetical protein